MSFGDGKGNDDDEGVFICAYTFLSIYTETQPSTHKEPKTIVRAPMYTHNREIMVGSLLSIHRLIACLHLASTELLFVTWKLCQNGDDGNNSSKKKKVEGFFGFV